MDVKNPTADSESDAGFLLGRKLEDDFCGELGVEGFAGSDTGRSVVVADGVVESEVASNRDATASGRSVVDAVEEVEHLSSELKGHTFEDLRVFEDRKVDVGVTRPVVAVAAGSAEVAWSRIGESAGAKPVSIRLLSLIALGDRADLVGAVVAFVGSADVAGCVDCEWLSSVEAQQRVKLPAVSERAHM